MKKQPKTDTTDVITLKVNAKALKTLLKKIVATEIKASAPTTKMTKATIKKKEKPKKKGSKKMPYMTKARKEKLKSLNGSAAVYA